MSNAISFYPTERTRKILELYFKNSGYSMSRTIEEIIASYHELYQSIIIIPELENKEQANLIINLLKNKFRVIPFTKEVKK